MRLVFRIAAISAVIGAIYGQVHGYQAGELFSADGILRGAVTGGAIALILGLVNAFVIDQPLAARPMQRAPFLIHVAVKTALYLGVILLALKLGAWVIPMGSAGQFAWNDVLFALATAFGFAFLIDVNQLLGQNVLLNFVTGRYYRPRLEDRVFLFIDMEGSTGLAERLGPLAFHRLLSRFVADLTGPIVAARGEIHAYVGDEVIATWPLAAGIARANCVRACFGAVDRLRAAGESYRREFGVAPAFRAGLHCGPVVTGEMGTIKKDIVFLGDTVNTTARIQDVCRQTGDRILASADLVDRLALPESVGKRSLGDLRLRGKGVDLGLYALEREGRPAAIPLGDAVCVARAESEASGL